MALKINTQYGGINIDNGVISRIAGLAAHDCCIVGMSSRNVKDEVTKLLKIENLKDGVVLKTKNDMLIIDLHIIVAYGTNIIAIAQTLISNVKYHVEHAVGLKVEQVNVFVDGVRISIE